MRPAHAQRGQGAARNAGRVRRGAAMIPQLLGTGGRNGARLAAAQAMGPLAPAWLPLALLE